MPSKHVIQKHMLTVAKWRLVRNAVMIQHLVKGEQAQHHLRTHLRHQAGSASPELEVIHATHSRHDARPTPLLVRI